MPRDTSGNERPRALAQPRHGIPPGALETGPEGPLGSAHSGDAGLQGPAAHSSAAWTHFAPTATTRCRILLSVIYHSDGKTNLKHLEIYVSDGSGCTVPLY